MSRLSRFEGYRFIGTRDTMLVYDCDDADQFTVLEELVTDGDLVGMNLLQSFSPDSREEAANRGFRSV